MSSLRTWFRGSSSTPASKPASVASKPSSLASQTSLNHSKAAKPASLAIDQEAADIEDAMAAAGLIMNDNIEGAEAQLTMREDPSAFHLLALGVATFMRSILGFEKDIMTEASRRLSECETKASAELKKVQREAGGGGYWYGRAAENYDATAGNIYPPGSEFALVHAEAQLMSAVVAVMHESLTEGIKGFYKLRKAYMALDGIMESEAKALERLQDGNPLVTNSAEQTRRPSLSNELMPGSFDEAEFMDFDEKTDVNTDSDADFFDASTGPSRGSANSLPKPGSDSNSGVNTPALEQRIGELSLTSSEPLRAFPLETGGTGADASLFTSTRDKFIHSGGNMCFGALMLIISMVPPAFSRLLQIVGFKGDRDRGVKMLWQSTKFPNINGAVAGLLLLAYYNGLLAMADILPGAQDIEELAKSDSDGGDIVGYPKERCTALLADMRARYPDSRLWMLEEARVLAHTKRLREAIEMLSSNSGSKMRQVTALNTFELSKDALFSLDWPLMRDSFLRCIELNEWSHAFYYYMVGCAELEQYRDAYHKAAALGDDGNSPQQLEEAKLAAKKHKKAAEEYLRKAPSLAGRKRFMARQMPLEVFVCRKLQKLEERARALDVDLADAAGPSLAMEMLYLFNGSKTMSPELLRAARPLLWWHRCTAPPDKVARIKEEKDEIAIQAVADAALLRSLGRVADARGVLEPILKLDRSVCRGGTRDDYVLAAAHYEVAAAAWVEASEPHHWPAGEAAGDVGAYRKGKVNECHEYLDKVAKWEGFVLDARFGMRVQAGLDSVRWLKGKKRWT